MTFFIKHLSALDGYKTFILAVCVTIAWFVRLFMLDDASAAVVMGGVSMGALLAGLGVLIFGGKSGDAKLKKLEESTEE